MLTSCSVLNTLWLSWVLLVIWPSGARLGLQGWSVGHCFQHASDWQLLQGWNTGPRGVGCTGQCIASQKARPNLPLSPHMHSKCLEPAILPVSQLVIRFSYQIFPFRPKLCSLPKGRTETVVHTQRTVAYFY